MTLDEDAVRFDSVQFAWHQRGGFRIQIPTFHIRPGERVLLVGPSGSGKSTFLSLVAGILSPQRGSIRIGGKELAGLSASARDRFRAENIGLIFQSLNLLPYLSALDNILLPLHFAPVRRNRLGSGDRAAAHDLLGRLGLPPQVYADQSAREMSVGQQQRVAVARSLIGGPALIVADEPTSALDTDHRHAFLDVLHGQLKHSSTALIMVSHDETLMPFFDRTVRLADVASTERLP